LHNLIECRMAAQQVGRAPLDDPRQVSLRQSVAQGAKHRQAVNAIANGA
jgi:hypothetical protein